MPDKSADKVGLVRTEAPKRGREGKTSRSFLNSNMVHLTIAGKDYTAFDTWAEMPLSKAVELSTLCHKEIPLPLKTLYDLYSKNKGDEEGKKSIEEFSNTLPDEEYIKNFPTFYGKVIQCLTTIPTEVIDQLTSGTRIQFYTQYLFKFVFGVIHFPYDFKENGIESFKHKDITYHLPKSKTVLGEVRPMADRTAIEFAEAADLEVFSKQLDGGRFERAANIVSVLCRPMVPKTELELAAEYGATKFNLKSFKKLKKESDYWKLEPYNEDTCLKRAEEFKELTMDTVWEVFFCLQQQSILLQQNTLISSLEALQKLPKQETAAV